MHATLAALALALLCTAARADELPALDAAARQAVAQARTVWVVTTPGWDASAATLVPWLRGDDGWRRGEALPATVGHGGLRWGRGLTSPPPGATRVKREGDGAAPAGLFRVTGVVGEAPRFEGALPYRHATAATRCVDDPASKDYTRIVEASDGPPPWGSAERMVREDGLYRVLALVDHNGGTPSPGGGSCIFVHAWSAPGAPTVGCVSLDPTALAPLLAAAVPPALVVVLPEPLLAPAAKAWGLPAAPHRDPLSPPASGR